MFVYPHIEYISCIIEYLLYFYIYYVAVYIFGWILYVNFFILKNKKILNIKK
jgi:hypothetical protein